MIPYAGAFKLTMDVDSIKPGRSIKWIAWFGEAVRKGYTETDDAALYRSKAGPKTTPLASIAGFEDRFRGEPTRAIPKVGMTVTPSPDHTGEAYSFHVAARGHNSAVYPLWMRPVTVGGNILYATVHQRFVYHLMFRLEKRHFARYELRTDAQKVARMMLPYTILIIDDDGTRKRLLAVYRGEVSVNGFPFEQLRRGAGVTVEALKTVPRRIYPEEAPQ
ncbi:hypothetical protein HQ560_15145 [bacterium]|nr:hypothetical protein [bacterium]